MPARRPVPSLALLVSRHLAATLLDRFCQCGDQVEDWAAGVSLLLHQHLQQGVYEEMVELLLAALDRDFANMPELRPRARQFVPCLLGPHMKSLDFTRLRILADKTIVRSLYSKFAELCPNLERLSLGQSFFFMPEMVSDLNGKLARLGRLVSLKLQYIATDIMLIDLGTICPRLVELSLKGSNKITDDAAEPISSCANLVVLDIQGTRISGAGCLAVLERCPRLEWVEHCPFNCDSDFQIFKSRKEMFQLIERYRELNAQSVVREGSELTQEKQNEGVVVPYNIKNLWLFNPESEELQVSQLCPRLERVRLDFVFQDMGFQLMAEPLSQYTHLTMLDLNFYDNHNNGLLEHILAQCGQRLKSLIYNVCADYRSVVDCHNTIARHCRSLTSLTFIGDYENAAHLDQETDSALLRRGDWQPHPLLEKLSLGGYCTDGRLAWLLSGCPNIRHVALDGNLERLSDSAWSAVLAENSLDRLETVWWNTSTNLTMETVRRLLECPRLRRVGRLVHLREHAGGARRDNLLQLLDQARKLNWDMEFVWVTPTCQPALVNRDQIRALE